MPLAVFTLSLCRDVLARALEPRLPGARPEPRAGWSTRRPGRAGVSRAGEPAHRRRGGRGGSLSVGTQPTARAARRASARTTALSSASHRAIVRRPRVARVTRSIMPHAVQPVHQRPDITPPGLETEPTYVRSGCRPARRCSPAVEAPGPRDRFPRGSTRSARPPVDAPPRSRRPGRAAGSRAGRSALLVLPSMLPRGRGATGSCAGRPARGSRGARGLLLGSDARRPFRRNSSRRRDLRVLQQSR